MEHDSGRLVGSDPHADAFAPDDYSADPRTWSHVGPGTVDDVPLDYGQELPDPADQHLILDHSALRRGECREDEIMREDLGLVVEDDLWTEQLALVEEDEASGLRMEGIPEERIKSVREAMGDEAADSLPDYPEGTSATGA